MAQFFAVLLHLIGLGFIASAILTGAVLVGVGGVIIIALAAIFEVLFRIRAVLSSAAERYERVTVIK